MAVDDYIKNDKTKSINVTKYEAGEWDPEINSESEKSDIITQTAHSKGTVLAIFSLFFGGIYSILIKKLSERLSIDNRTIFFKTIYFFSIGTAILTWILIFCDGTFTDIFGMPFANHKFF